MTPTTTEVAKPKSDKKHLTYPFSIEESLYNAAKEHCDMEGYSFAQYIRKLIKQDLKQRGLLP